MKSFALIFTFLLFLIVHQLAAVERFSFPKPKDMTRADVVKMDTVQNPKAVLVLCPGFNGNGESMITQKEWQDFARANNLGLIGINFESPGDLLMQCQGYYQVQNGSGEVLLTAIKKIYGRDLPILIFGFSGGAHFTTRFIEWNPKRVLAWCALGAGVLDSPKGNGVDPPGIMACGEEDTRLGGALVFFKQGRSAGRLWLFACLPKLDHSMSPKLNSFVRNYFHAILTQHKNTGVWVDEDNKELIPQEKANEEPSLSGWLPEEKLLQSWRLIHEL